MNDPLLENHRLPADLEGRVRSELQEGERVLWFGQPLTGTPIRMGVLVALVAGLPSLVFGLVWFVMTSGMLSLFGFEVKGKPVGFPAFAICLSLFGLPIVLVGLGLMAAPYWFWRQARRTCYAVTDRRAILWTAGKVAGWSIRSYPPDSLAKLHRVEKSDGSGDLVFEEQVSITGDDQQTARTVQRGFMGIENVHEVEKLLRRALLSSGDGTI